MVSGDVERVESELRAGRLRCPWCADRLARWGRARDRSVRSVGGVERRVQPRRARCVGCACTHVLLPDGLLVRRRDGVEVIGAALVANVAGVGHRRIAERLGLPVATVRGWLRRFRFRAAAPHPSADPLPEWTKVFETRPCLKRSANFDDIETGGRLAWDRQGRLLFSVGDHGLDGLSGQAVSQQTDNDYGKVLRVDRSGAKTIFTLGHRNPQGLLDDRDGRIWETEHGPQGGAELNLLVEGKNYGWPLATYGTDYGRLTWPLAIGQHDHGRFTEPVYAFVPSIGISNLIQLGGKQFPAWKDDLLVGSLRMETLFRLRMRRDHVIYAEPIPLGSRIRDLKEGSDGRIVVWTDIGDVIVLARAPLSAGGALVYDHDCRTCHEPGVGVIARGPSLNSLVARRVASGRNYPYSQALRKLGGTWTVTRLDEFLRSPNAYAPGTSMEYGGLADATDRRSLIEFLRDKYAPEGPASH